jgi:DNA polymerase-1
MAKNTPPTKTLVLIDGNAIIHRAYHAVPPLTTKDGTVVNAVYGFVTTLLRVIQELKPTHLGVCFDVAGGTFRDDLYTEYKATRAKADDALYKQIPLVHEMVRTMGIAVFTKTGFEADDVMGTISSDKSLRKQGIETMIVTGDMDILQLIDEHTRVYELRKGLSDIVIFDAEKVKEKYQFGPEKIVDYKALRGDTSDNIPGIKGIGEKTATELITKIGGVDDIYTDLQKKDSVIRSTFTKSIIAKLDGGREAADLSKTLATIRRDVPDLDFSLEAAAMKPFDFDILEPLLLKFEFFSLLKRLRGDGPAPKTKKASTEKKIPVETVSAKAVKETLLSLQDLPVLALKEEVTTNDILTGALTHIILGSPLKTYIFAWEDIQKNQDQFIKTLNSAGHIVGHDLKEAYRALLYSSIRVAAPLFDLMIASYVVNSSTRAHELESIVERELHYTLPEKSAQTSLFRPRVEESAEQISVYFPLYTIFAKSLQDMTDAGFFETMEMKLIPVLSAMELVGVEVDLKVLGELSETVKHSLDKLTKQIWKEAGTEFNVASNNQLRDILFETLGLPTEGIKKGKTGYSTAAPELEKLRESHAIIPLIEEHRELAKLQNTYIDVLPTLVNPRTGRIHSHFNQAIAATGRLSSKDPNLQNIPIRTELGSQVRNTFIAAKGYKLISADYSQIELRIVASLAEDKRMMEIFKEGKDIHTSAAAAIHGVKESEVTKDMRYAAKAVNFGILYGMGSFGLAWRTQIPQWQAKAFIEAYFKEYAGVKTYIDNTIKFATECGYVETLYGRRRYIPELASDNHQLRAAGERMAVNMPIQGTNADIIKLAMISLQEELLKRYPLEDARITLQVHDELVLECKEDIAEEVAELAKQKMIEVVKLKVPVEVHVAIGDRWGELK